MPARKRAPSRPSPGAGGVGSPIVGEPTGGPMVGTGLEIDTQRHSPRHVIAGLRATSEGEDLVQLLTPEGQRVEHPEFELRITPAQIQALYRDMALVRRADREASALQRQGQLGLWAPLLGQEAAQIGAGRALAPQDMVFPSYREH